MDRSPAASIISWDDASSRVGGGEPDAAFLAELLCCFWHEGVSTLESLLTAIMAYRSSHGDASLAEPTLSAVQHAAHAIKGTSLNLSLLRIAEIAERLERVAKDAISGTLDRPSSLATLCLSPSADVQDLVREWQKFTTFMMHDLAELMPENFVFSRDFDTDAYTRLQCIRSEIFAERIAPYATLL